MLYTRYGTSSGYIYFVSHVESNPTNAKSSVCVCFAFKFRIIPVLHTRATQLRDVVVNTGIPRIQFCYIWQTFYILSMQYGMILT